MDDKKVDSEDTPLQTTVRMKNDPWKPIENEIHDIPKILPAPQDPLRNMISSESYVKSLGTN